MSNETFFKLMLGILVVFSFGIRLYFQVSASGVRREKARDLSRDRFFYNLVLGTYLLVFVVVSTPWLDFAQVPLPEAVRWLGVVLLITASGLFAWSHIALGRNWSGVLELAEGHQLVTSGPYRWVRHPMYTAFFLAALGMFLLSANGLFSLVHVAAVVGMYLARVSGEEAMMIERFGDVYRGYMARTGRLLPRLGP